jgi:hypothetical protein
LPTCTAYGCSPSRTHLSSDGNLNLDTGLDVDDDLLDDLGWRIQINQALVDAHLVHIPGLGTLTTGRLAGGDLMITSDISDLLSSPFS